MWRRYPAEERRIRRMLLQHRFVGESVISGANTLYDIALSEVGSFEELPGIHYVIPPGFESVIDILRDNVPPNCLLLQHVVTNITWNNSDLCEKHIFFSLNICLYFDYWCDRFSIKFQQNLDTYSEIRNPLDIQNPIVLDLIFSFGPFSQLFL